jgi:hypothetical protein
MVFTSGSPEKLFISAIYFRRVPTMKNTMIRAFVVALALTGAAATAHSKTTGNLVSANSSRYPLPLCPPNDPNGCGIK